MSSANCVIIDSTSAGTFTISDGKLYVSVVTSSTQSNAKLLSIEITLREKYPNTE